MFSMVESLTPFCNQSHYYTPHKPSPLSSSPLRSLPLSPRDTNALLSPPAFNTMTTSSRTPLSKASSAFPPTSGTSLSTSGSSSSRRSAYATRTTKTNPLIHGKNVTDGRERRRNLFLKKVRGSQEDKRWEARGGDDEIMRMIWVAEQRRREERISRGALGLNELAEEDEDMLNLDEVLADEVAMQEDEELEAILESLTQNSRGNRTENQSQETLLPQMSAGAARTLNPIEFDTFRHAEPAGIEGQSAAETPYASDDEDYDRIFMDVIQQEMKGASQQAPAAYADHEMMDMS